MSEPKSLVDPVRVDGPADELLEACLPVPEAHRAGDATGARILVSRNPEAARDNVWVAAATGELDAVREALDADPSLAGSRGGTRCWEPLLYLCFSTLLRGADRRAERMVETARLLLEAGADPNAYWVDPAEAPGNRETPLYGAAGIANRPDLVRLLVEHGADPNDGETPYHMVEHDGVPSAPLLMPLLDELSRGMALGHKLDYDDLDGLRVLLELGADPNGPTPFPRHPIHQAVWRSRPRPFFDLLAEYGADFNLPDGGGKTAYSLAARAGARETMEWLIELGAHTELEPIDRFLSACALARTDLAQRMLEDDPAIADRLGPRDRATICEAAAAGNTAGVKAMLDLGWDVDTRGTAWCETPLHRAALEGRTDTVELLLSRGADVSLRDGSYDATPAGWARHAGHRRLADRIESGAD